jgi:hypothetical protein
MFETSETAATVSQRSQFEKREGGESGMSDIMPDFSSPESVSQVRRVREFEERGNHSTCGCIAMIEKRGLSKAGDLKHRRCEIWSYPQKFLRFIVAHKTSFGEMEIPMMSN